MDSCMSSIVYTAFYNTQDTKNASIDKDRTLIENLRQIENHTENFRGLHTREVIWRTS